jgi:hypothetical protein
VLSYDKAMRTRQSGGAAATAGGGTSQHNTPPLKAAFSAGYGFPHSLLRKERPVLEAGCGKSSPLKM